MPPSKHSMRVCVAYVFPQGLVPGGKLTSTKTMTFQTNIDEPCTIRGYVLDSAVISPMNGVMTHCLDEYNITIELEDPCVADELEMVFELNDHPQLESSANWKLPGVDRSVTAYSIVEPRLGGISRHSAHAEEIKVGTLVDLRCKAVIKELDQECLHTLQIIGVSIVDRAEEEVVEASEDDELYNF